MNLKDLMKNTPETLAAYQHQELKKHVLCVLNKVVECVEREEYDVVESLTFYSPAGDGYGLDNNCIDFSYDEEKKYGEDILEATGKLAKLKKLSDGK